MRPLAVGLTVALLGACSPQSPSPQDPTADAANSAIDSEVATIINLQDRTELEMLKERVVTLEREVEELKANPQTIDLDLLTKRVDNLEAASATAATGSVPSSDPTAQAGLPKAKHAIDATTAQRRASRDQGASPEGRAEIDGWFLPP